MSYAEFLAAKTRAHRPLGPDCSPSDVSPLLHPWQAEAVAWAVRTGRAGLWWDTGLGKTRAQLEWARLSAPRSLIVTPLAVSAQTVREAQAIGLDAQYARVLDGCNAPIVVTNLEMAARQSWDGFGAVVLDEASILRAYDGATKKALTDRASAVPLRLSCTATPMPNDVEELCNQAEWLGMMPRQEMLAAYFVHDSDTGWRLKGHAGKAMWRWMATWAHALRRPSDMGYPDTGYDLPEPVTFPHLLHVDHEQEGQLFPTDLGGVGGRAKIRRSTMQARVDRTVEMVNAEPGEPWIVWCGLNDEANAVAAAIPGAVNVEGSWAPEAKADALMDFADGRTRVLVTKTSIAGFGMNFQHCARMAFCGMNDSWESYYQAVRRCHRYGQTRPVHVHLILSEMEGQIAANIGRKERQAATSIDSLIREMQAAKAVA